MPEKYTIVILQNKTKWAAMFCFLFPVPWPGSNLATNPSAMGVEAWRPKFCNFQAFVTQLLEAEVEAGIYVYILSNG